MNQYKSKWREDKENEELENSVTWLNIIVVLSLWCVVAYLIYRTML